MENNRTGCINRDENTVNNMIKLTRYYLKHKYRPEKFRRDHEFPEKIKGNNPSISKSNVNVKYSHALRSTITLSFND